MDLLSNKVSEFLMQSPDQRFTARKIAEWIFETYPDECKEKQNRSQAKVTPIGNNNILIQQIAAEIGSYRLRIQKKYSKIKTTESRPRLYYYESSDYEPSENIASTSFSVNPSIIRITEHDLYDKLSQFLGLELNIRCRRIDEKVSHNSRGSNGNKWLHPDVVGIEDLSQDWDEEVKSCVQRYADKKTKLWSFEVKIEINSSNIREAFFQAVSNSSWANFGYLVANDLIEDKKNNTLKELRILSALHGIGFIQLDAENPTDSLIMIPAKEKSNIDWNTVNRLVAENPDFREYIKLVFEFYGSDRLRNDDWDVTS